MKIIRIFACVILFELCVVFGGSKIEAADINWNDWFDECGEDQCGWLFVSIDRVFLLV